MPFWDEHEASEQAIKVAARAPQNVLVGECLECGDVKNDVMFGTCADCFTAWEAEHERAAVQP